MRIRLLTFVLGVVLLGITASPAVAQEAGTDPRPRGDVAFGYAFLHDQSMQDILEISGNFPLGWVGSVSARAGWFAVVGEFSGNYKTAAYIGDADTFTYYTFLGGARFSSGRATTPFAQLLVGGTRSYTVIDGDSFPAISNLLTIQPGVGMDVRMGSVAGVRLQADYRRVRKDPSLGLNVDRFQSHFRVCASIVFFLGRQ